MKALIGVARIYAFHVTTKSLSLEKKVETCFKIETSTFKAPMFGRVPCRLTRSIVKVFPLRQQQGAPKGLYTAHRKTH